MAKHIYMLIERDEYELPIAWAETIRELAEKLGMHENTIRRKMYVQKQRGEWCEFIKIPFEGDFSLADYSPYEKPNAGIKPRKVFCYKNGYLYKCFNSVGDCAREFGVSKTTIGNYIKKGTGRDGCTFRWEERNE